jgi:LuxR family maltose regulon positive regulatory protein
VATLRAGRAALARGAWAEARASFEAALGEEESAEALEGLSWAAWWLDDVDACFDARERAYRGYRAAGDLRGAARMALWLSDDYSEFRREEAVSGGWFQRAARLLEELPPAPEHGWLAVFEAHATLAAGDPEGALGLAGRARDLGRDLGAVDVEMFAVATEGVH